MCPLKHPSRAHSQATLAAQCPITVQMQRINEKTDLEMPAAAPSPARGKEGDGWTVSVPQLSSSGT